MALKIKFERAVTTQQKGKVIAYVAQVTEEYNDGLLTFSEYVVTMRMLFQGQQKILIDRCKKQLATLEGVTPE